jgi:hypothetical protein
MSTSHKDATSSAEPRSDSRSAPLAHEAKDASSHAGRIVHDSRGNAVWNWNKGSDPSSTATTSKMLRKLDLANLQVEGAAQPEEAAPPEKEAAKKKRGSGYGPGYNPYDRTAPVRIPPKK